MIAACWARSEAVRRHIVRRGDKPEHVVQARVKQLDSGMMVNGLGASFILRHSDPREHFAEVMSSWTDALTEEWVDREIPIAPAIADDIVTHSALLKEIATSDPSLVAGPMDRRRQYWTPGGGTTALNGEAPSRAQFMAADESCPIRVKPSRFGLYTSTGSSTGPSMWRLLLGLGGTAGSWPRTLGCYTWALDVEPNVRVAEIVTASDWVQFVCEHPYRDGDRVLPNWVDIAQKFDAVHFALPVIAAVQSLPVRAGDAIIPAAYWDVETTFWLNWRFSDVHLLESPDA
jgi:hypothetical protein